MTWLHFTFQGQEYSVPGAKIQELLLPSSPWITPQGGDYVLHPDFFSPARRVPDKQRYTLECLAGRWALRFMNGELATGPFTPDLDRDVVPGQADIVLLLESPHTDEYTPGFEPLGPARGATGRNIHQYLCSHVLPILLHHGLQLKPERRYTLYLVNPIPYQTSLGHALEKFDATLRNAIWLEMWDACRENFEQRLSRYGLEIIWNGCTSVTKSLVADSVRGYAASQHFNVTHPSAWQGALAGFNKAE